MGEGRIPVLGPIQGKPDLGPPSRDLMLAGNRVSSQFRPPNPKDGGPGKVNRHREIRI